MREAEPTCPFCGKDQRLSSSATSGPSAALGAFALVATLIGTSACVRTPSDPNATSTTTTTSSTSTTTDETVETSTDDGTETSTDPTTTTNTSGSFYAGPDIDAGVYDCDPWLQDCPDGEKCVPYSNDGGSWNANKCVPVTDDGSAGDACVYSNIVEAEDDCGPDTHCWNLHDVDGTIMGTCRPFCTGTPDAPSCPEGSECLIANQGVITTCLETCDPLMQACPDGQTCAWETSTDSFVCEVDDSDDAQGQACNIAGSCDAGLTCVSADIVPGCDSVNGCCTAWCDTQDQNACVDLGLACLPYFEQGMAPVGYETLGVCGQAP